MFPRFALSLNAILQASINDRLVLAFMNFAMEVELPDVHRAAEDTVDHAAGRERAAGRLAGPRDVGFRKQALGAKLFGCWFDLSTSR